RLQLSNGMRVLLLENHETPAVRVTALVLAGSVFDPPDRAGLAALTGTLLRSGGVRTRTPDRLDLELESHGAAIETSIGDTTAAITMSSLRESLAESLTLFRAVLTEPSFRQDRIDFYRAIGIRAIARRNDDTRDALEREFRTLLYGKESAAGRRP